MSRYRCILLGHEEKLIQERLDLLPPSFEVISIVVIGVNVLAIVDSRGHRSEMLPVIGEKDESTLYNDGKGIVYSNPSSQSFGKPKPAKAKLS